jgi:hypothetical protein
MKYVLVARAPDATFTRHMNTPTAHEKRRHRWVHFFPVQLVLLHLKKNHFLLLIWVFLFGITTGVFAKNIGVPQQFLVPEYLGATGIVSFAILGFAMGGFISGFNLYTYIMHGYRFPFIATLSRPFQKFCLNNFLLPGIFLIIYTYCSARFQIEKELVPPLKAVLNLVSFFIALTLFQALSYVYFMYTNKDAQAYGKGRKRKIGKEDAPVESPIHHPLKWFRMRWAARKWHVETYISSFRRISLARDSQHYSREVLEKVFSQNHINGSRFEIVLVVSFLIIGSLRSHEMFVIPAAASAMLFFTMMIMLISALHSWLRGWTLTLFIFFLLGLNFFYDELKMLRQDTKAYGMNYETGKARYDLEEQIPDSATVKNDIDNTIEILENWKRKTSAGSDKKPKLIIFNHSGGGSRSAFWTMSSVAYADSACEGRLLENTVMMTGASGGMLGAAYLREIMLRKAWGEDMDLYDTAFAENIARDLLNPIVLSTATNDWFIRYQRLYDGEFSYSKDRATAFEEQLNRNTDNALQRRLGDYSRPEYEAVIPMMILSPTIVNDGRRLLIASQPISYLTKAFHVNGSRDDLPEDIEFSRMFREQNAANLRYTSALRMNATFPYVLPLTTLPSEPPISVLDAGIRDNFGLKTTMQFLYTFRNWINQNTSGVIIIQVRDLPKNKDLREHKPSLFGEFSAPIGGIYGNITKTQDYNSEQALRYLQGWFGQQVNLVTFELEQDRESHISLSWHLTKSEKKQIRTALEDDYFQEELARLKMLMEQ